MTYWRNNINLKFLMPWY